VILVRPAGIVFVGTAWGAGLLLLGSGSHLPGLLLVMPFVVQTTLIGLDFRGAAGQVADVSTRVARWRGDTSVTSRDAARTWGWIGLAVAALGIAGALSGILF
jgi:hypothetical protein